MCVRHKVVCARERKKMADTDDRIFAILKDFLRLFGFLKKIESKKKHAFYNTPSTRKM